MLPCLGRHQGTITPFSFLKLIPFPNHLYLGAKPQTVQMRGMALQQRYG